MQVFLIKKSVKNLEIKIVQLLLVLIAFCLEKVLKKKIIFFE